MPALRPVRPSLGASACALALADREFAANDRDWVFAALILKPAFTLLGSIVIINANLLH